MPYITMKQVRRIAERAGHRDLAVTETRRGRYIVTCSCGYRSASRIKVADAAGAAAHHMTLVAEAWARSGAPMPADTPDDEAELQSHPLPIPSP